MNISGIYKIQSKLKPNKIYIGSAINITKRWERHKGELKKSIHCNSKLQRHYNKYGKNDLQYSIIIGCDKEKLIEYEQFFIDALNPCFNCRKNANNNLGIKYHINIKHKKPINDETRQRLSEIKRKWWEDFNKDRQHYIFKKDMNKISI